jgi:hypothetical protein
MWMATGWRQTAATKSSLDRTATHYFSSEASSCAVSPDTAGMSGEDGLLLFLVGGQSSKLRGRNLGHRA